MMAFLKTLWSYRDIEIKERAQQHWMQVDLLSQRFFIVEGMNKKNLPERRMLGDAVAAIDFSRQLKAGTSRITVFDQSAPDMQWACGAVRRFAGPSMDQVHLIESYEFDLVPQQKSVEEESLVTLYRRDKVG
jgi:hypothetical protein